MRRPTSILISSLLLMLVTVPAGAESLTAEDRQSLTQHLARTQKLFLDSVAGLSEAQLSFQPAEDKWSIAECIEHLTVAEKFIRDTTTGFLETPATAEVLEQGCVKEDTVLKFMLDRSQKFQAPEPVQPSRRWSSVAEMLNEFRQQRALTTELAATDEDLRAYCGEHPGFGLLDAYGWLIFLSSHTERHTLQIEEVKADPAFPES